MSKDIQATKPGNTAKSASLIKSLAGTVGTVGNVITSTASQTGNIIAQTASKLGNTAHSLLTRATQDTGKTVTFIGDSPVIRRLSRALKLDALIGTTDKVDLKKAEEAVRVLQRKYPDETPRQIAHRIMVEKAVYAGGVGLASSLVPGQAIALLAVDLATTTALQTEMVYQIAAAYGLDLQDAARKGEVVAIFALSFGGSRAIKAGLAFVKTVPLVGAAIGASANATMLYTLGYAACRFYEAKVNPDVVETSTETLEEIKAKTEKYLEIAIAQQAIMDQILANMILAAYPDRKWEDILPSLKEVKLSPGSLEAIANHLKSPQPLIALIDQLDQDFAVLTVSRCYAIAQLDGTLNPEEAKILEALTDKFNINLDEMTLKKAP